MTESVHIAPLVAYAAFMDTTPVFELQAYTWARSLISSGVVARSQDIFIGTPPARAASPPGWIDELGLTVVPVERWDHRSPHCNKIGLWRSEWYSDYQAVCFNDCDLFYLGAPDLDPGTRFAGGLVDRPTRGLERAFRQAGIEQPCRRPVRYPYDEDESTLETNLNGGFYWVHPDLVEPLGAGWARWARWCLDSDALRHEVGIHSDQVGMALALADLGIPISEIPPTVNVPTHLKGHPDVGQRPVVLHYHRHTDHSGLLLDSGKPNIDSAVRRANVLLREWHAEGMDNSLFSNYRAHHARDLLGSSVWRAIGVGGDRAGVLRDRVRWVALGVLRRLCRRRLRPRDARAKPVP